MLFQRKRYLVNAVQFQRGMETGFIENDLEKPYLLNKWGYGWEALDFNYGCWLIRDFEGDYVEWYTDEEFKCLFEEYREEKK